MHSSDAMVDELRDALAPELHLLERLGSGGMGDVFLARDPALKRNVAVKVLAHGLGVSEQARQRFAREAEAAAAVAHPNVVPIYRVGTLPRSRLGYIVMAHVDGPSLRELVPAGTVAPESEVRRMMAEVASALAAAHARGVVHRDIKPANILYDPLGGRFVVVDFGIAAVLDPDTPGRQARITVQGLPIGTPEYMSPEQVAGDPAVEKSDVYSLGCLAYELLAGRPPLTGPTPAAVASMQIHEQPAPVSALRSELDPEFAALVMRCLRKDPDARPTADDLTRALGLVRRARVEWPPPGLEQLQRQGAHWARAVGRLAVGLFLFIAILGIHPAAARPCCADSPDRSPGWLVLKRLSMATPIHFDDPDALGIWYFLLDAAFLLLLAALVPLVVRTARLTARLVAGRRAGYPLPVLARVAWDRHRDTGDLINLSGRYALAAPEWQARQLRRRDVAAGAITLASAVLIASCLAWLGGLLEFQTAAATGVLPLAELAALAAPAAVLAGIYLVLTGIHLGQRRTAKPMRGVRKQPLRSDVLAAWMAAAGVHPPAERWSQPAIRAAGLLTIVGGATTAIVAAYGLIAVFGASARFAGDRALGTRWLQSYAESSGPGVDPPALDPRTALALVASIPLDAGVARALIERRLTASDRRLLYAAVGPAFCLNPREVLFGVAPDRFDERVRVARMVGVDSAAGVHGFDGEALRDGGLAGLRRRARFCERYFGDQASISPQPRATEGR